MKEIRLGADLALYVANPGEARLLYQDIFIDRSYLKFGLTLAPRSTIVDVGANIGLFTLFAHFEAPGGKIIAVEPVPHLVDVLKANIQRHCVDAIVINRCLSDRVGKGSLIHYLDNSALSGLHANIDAEQLLAKKILRNRYPDLSAAMVDGLLAAKFRHETIECETTTLSNVIHQHQIERIDLLKIDVEKAEMDVLMGILATDWPRIQSIVLEVHDIDGRVESVVRLLKTHGFAVEAVQNQPFAGTELFDLYASRLPLQR